MSEKPSPSEQTVQESALASSSLNIENLRNVPQMSMEETAIAIRETSEVKDKKEKSALAWEIVVGNSHRILDTAEALSKKHQLSEDEATRAVQAGLLGAHRFIMKRESGRTVNSETAPYRLIISSGASMIDEVGSDISAFSISKNWQKAFLQYEKNVRANPNAYKGDSQEGVILEMFFPRLYREMLKLKLNPAEVVKENEAALNRGVPLPRGFKSGTEKEFQRIYNIAKRYDLLTDIVPLHELENVGGLEFITPHPEKGGATAKQQYWRLW